jgi:hypothetical protein
MRGSFGAVVDPKFTGRDSVEDGEDPDTSVAKDIDIRRFKISTFIDECQFYARIGECRPSPFCL